MAHCLFCDIVAGSIPCEEVYADDEILAFRDINPQAPVHVLIIPKRHIASVAELEERDAAIMGRLALVAARLATDLGLAESGYRWVINCGADGGQAVGHIHLHLLGGRSLKWPPG